MIGLEEATRIALDYLSKMESPLKLVLIQEKIIEFEEGYVFYWDSEAHAKDGLTDRILGSTPFLLINKTALFIEQAIIAFIKKLKPS